ncbi:stearoyl-CoA desaturase 5-like [Chironomus tepperi]|uniref:stearoyl-CoA desaturase 5-like n=1 Tax=Chironomus tepperi TaxID=113505 RepID=UPI00391F1B63
MKKVKFLMEENDSDWKDFKNYLSSFNWNLVTFLVCLYIGGLIGLYHLLTLQLKFYTYVWVYHVFLAGGIGLGPGAHRFFSHRSYKATRGFKLFLIFCQTLAGQYSVIFWCQVHRSHHKYTDTEKDPTNIKRGFWFAHLFWAFRYSPECRTTLNTVDVSDLRADKDVMFQYRHYELLCFLICIVYPTIIPYLLWNETLWISFWANMFRWLLNYNQMSFANSLMHMYGKKPYDKNHSAAEYLFCILYTYGEGYHNYHHVFPWDYKAAEFGDFAHFNISTILLDVCAKFGLVYDRKVVTQSMIERRKARTGDGSYWLTSEEILKNPIWGFGDINMDIDDKMDIHEYVYDQNNNVDDKKKDS